MNNDKIDQRIVEMSFENYKFEKGISQSQESLKKFSDALKNSDINQSFSGLDKSVGVLSNSMSMMEQIGVGALRRIGESAVIAGTQMIKSLTIGQVVDGFHEYELKMNTIRAVMNSTGDSATDVREKLKVLDDYADKTIFSTRDMFDNLATFTNNGIKLSEATKAMIGVANATAYAGQGALSATYAYRNFADAISNGYMSLTDWRSISRVAKIGTQEFRQEILKTAVEMGTLTQAQIDTGKVTTNFEDTLKDQWLTADVVTAVLGKYGDATTEVGAKAWAAAQEVRTFSGMMESLKASIGTQFANTAELIFGDLDEAKANFTYLNKILTTVFADSLKDGNEMLAWVKKLGGVANIFDGLKNSAIAFLTVIRPIAKAFEEIFPPKTKEQWLAITKVFKDFTASLKIADSTGDKIRRTFAGLFAVLDIGWQIVKFLGRSVFELVNAFLPLGDGILGASASLGDLLVNINKAIKSSQIFQYGIIAIKVGAAMLREQLYKTIAVVKDFVIGLWNAEDPFEYIKNAGKNLFSGFLDGIKMVTTWISEKFTKAVRGTFKLFGKDFDENVVGVWPTILNVLKEVVKFIGGEATDGFTKFGEAIKGLDFNKIATFVVGGVVLMFIQQLSDLTKSMAGFTNSLSGAVKAFTKSFLTIPQAGTIKEIALAIGVLAASIWVLSTIPADDLERAFLGMAGAIGVFVVAYGLIQAINVTSRNLTKDKELMTSAFGLTGVAAALLIMAAAVKTISKVSPEDVWNSTLVVGAMLGFLTAYQAVAALVSKIPGQQKVTANVLGMSLGVSMLIGSMLLLKFLSRSDLEDGLGKLATIMLVIGAIEGVFALTTRIGGGNKLSANFLQLGIGIAAMVATMKLLTLLDRATITQSIGNLALITLTIAGVELVMGLAARLSGGKKVQTNILAMQFGMLTMIGLVAIVGTMKSSTLDQGIENLAKMAGLVAGIQLVTALSSRIAGGTKVQKSLGAVSFTLLSFTGIIAILGTMKEETIDQGLEILKRMVGLIGAIELMTALTSKISGNSKMFSSLLGVTIAIVALTGSLALLSIVDQGFLRQAVESLTIAAAAIGVLAFSVHQITSSVGVISKGSKSFKAGIKNFATTVIGIGVILGATAAFFGIMSDYLPVIKTITIKDMAVFTTGFGAMTMLFGVVNHMGKELTKGQFDKQLNGLKAGLLAMGEVFVATAAFFGVLALTLPIIKNVTADDFAIFLIGMASVTSLLIATNYLGKQLTTIQLDKQLNGLKAGLAALGGILVATAAFFGVVSLLLPIIKNVEPTDLTIFLVGLTAVSGLLTGINYLGKQLTDIQLGKQLNGLKAGFIALGGILVATAGFFGVMALILPILKNVEWGDFAMFMTAVAGVTTILGGVALLGKAFEALGQGGLAVIKGVGIAILAMVAVVASVALLAEALNLLIADESGLTRGINLLVEIGEGLGRFIGSIIGGIGGGILESTGESIANFAAIMNGVAFSQESLDAITALSGAVLVISSAALVDGFNRFIGLGTSSMDTFGKQLSGLITAVKNVTIEDAQGASATLAAMKPMAENLKVFADVAKTIPNSGGFLGGFVGDNDIDKFGQDLTLFVATLSYISTEQAVHMTEVLTAMRPMVENLKLFAVTAQSIPNSGGFVEDFMGGNDIDKFGRQLVKFITVFTPILPQQATHMTEVLAAMKPMSVNLREFAEVSKDIPNSGGWIGGIVGDNTIDEFGRKLASLIEIFGTINLNYLTLANSNLLSMNTNLLPSLRTFVAFADSISAYQGFDLVAFANDLRAFVVKLSETDFTVVKPAMAAMDDITASFQTMGATVLENARKSFENNKEPFQTVIVSILQESIKKLNGQKKEIIDKFTGIFSSVVARINSYIQTFKNLGVNVINGFIEGLETRRPMAVNTVQGVLTAVIIAAQRVVDAHSPSRVFKSIGGWCTLGLAKGIKEKTDSAVQAGTNMARATEEAVRNTLGVHSLSTLFSGIGNWIGKSLGVGTTESIPDAVAAATNLSNKITEGAKNTLQNGMDPILQKAKEYGVDIGGLTAESVASAVTGTKGGLTSTLDNLLKILTDPKSAATAGKAGSSIANAFSGGVNGSGGTGGVAGAAKKAKTEIEKLKEALDELNFYGNISLDEELAKYQALRKKYKEGSEEEDKQIDREIYTRLKTINTAQMSYIDGVKKAKTDAAKEVADLELKYNADVAAELKSAEAERERTRKEYADRQEAINKKLLSDIDAQNQAYENAVKSRANAIANSYGLFDSVDLNARASGFELLKNLHDQNDALTVWKHSLEQLKERGISSALLEELQAMGPSANAQLRALLSLTDEQLTDYVGLFERKYSFGTDKAESELVGLKNTTVQAIADLRSGAATELEGLSVNFNETMTQINTDSATRLGELDTSFNENLTSINKNLETNLATMKTQFDTTMKTIKGQTEAELVALIATNKKKLEELNKTSGEKLGEVKTTFSVGASALVSSFGEPIKKLAPNTTAAIDGLKPSLVETFKGITSDFVTAGLNAAEGFAQGIYDGTVKVVEAAKYMASNAVTTARTILNENSPSKVFEAIGQFVSVGFANGIKDYAGQASKASEDLARGPIAAVSEALANMQDSDEYSFTITPVIDLSAIRSTDLSRLVGTPISLGGASTQLAGETVQNGIRTRQAALASNQTSNSTTNNSTINMTNNFSVRSDDDIRKISSRLGNLVDRYNNAKGVTVGV